MGKQLNRQRHITEFDAQRLGGLLADATAFMARDKEHLENLEEELDRGHVVCPKSVPPAVVTLNSRVRLKDLDRGTETVYTLVPPLKADIERNKISILAPIGTAILGQKVSAVIELNAPGGLRRLRVETILYQPEAAGDYHLWPALYLGPARLVERRAGRIYSRSLLTGVAIPGRLG